MPAPRATFESWFHEYEPPEPDALALSQEQQDAVALWLVNSGGRSAWNGTGC